ncbi:hypothetical protein PRIPAC_77513 [Pristionchus pacificus]|uniref:Uncharacterized protein n=1 Tax=Pristionchus pacificus TaxID=54126 RepID=A0A2A6C2U3_PRIPA|nr:hypothetical protein PRIPAC_77513 [Pristionchus pacificus]|eukprot:PDM72429.1 hypothetical protein PRIPAC_38863 [Pristionchus pacificus]
MSIRSESKGVVFWTTFDNVSKRNAITNKMYDELCTALDSANSNDDILFTVFTGAGDFYSSGNYFSREELNAKTYSAKTDDEGGFSRVLRRLIYHRKVLIGLVNGPAIGFACTTLGLFDYVVCSDSAYFLTPFVSLGISPEGTSSVVFQRVMGISNANEMLLFNEIMTAKQALERGFVSQVIPKDEFIKKSAELIEKLSQLPKHSLLASRELIRNWKRRREMKSIHNEESDVVKELLDDPRTIALMKNKFGKNKL